MEIYSASLSLLSCTLIFPEVALVASLTVTRNERKGNISDPLN